MDKKAFGAEPKKDNSVALKVLLGMLGLGVGAVGGAVIGKKVMRAGFSPGGLREGAEDLGSVVGALTGGPAGLRAGITGANYIKGTDKQAFYNQGVIDKCAEYGIDPNELIKRAQGYGQEQPEYPQGPSMMGNIARGAWGGAKGGLRGSRQVGRMAGGGIGGVVGGVAGGLLGIPGMLAGGYLGSKVGRGVGGLAGNLAGVGPAAIGAGVGAVRGFSGGSKPQYGMPQGNYSRPASGWVNNPFAQV